MRQITYASLASFLCWALVGCGGPDAEEPTAPPPTTAETAAPQSSPFAIAKGKAIYNKTCVSCHGENGRGIEGLGKDWTQSDFIATHSDDELIQFIKEGRTLDDPLSAGEAIMPPKGGDPTLTDQDLRNVVAYMRTLNEG